MLVAGHAHLERRGLHRRNPDDGQKQQQHQADEQGNAAVLPAAGKRGLSDRSHG